ncbi:MAG TPA: LEA type 2 family protein [Trueperaceae bacterium]|nr:LEA type 2 family protein [Trueperaceae bacterium]
MRRRWLWPGFALVLLLAVMLSGCAPGATPAVTPPTFEAVADGTGLAYVDPPGVGAGAAVFDVHLLAHNPNPFGIDLSTLDTDFYLGGRQAASGTFQSGVHIPAQGTGDLRLKVEVPLSAAPGLLSTFARLVAGGAVEYRLDAVVGVNALGFPVRFPRATLGRGSISANLAWYAPQITIAASGASLRIDSLTHASFEVPASLHNPARLGYLIRTPSLQLRLAGTTVARARLSRIVAPAGTTVPVTLSFDFDPLALGPALAAQLQAVVAGAGRVTFVVSGPLTLDAPGIASHDIPASSLLSGSVR